jgi:hypothetical protein
MIAILTDLLVTVVILIVIAIAATAHLVCLHIEYNQQIVPSVMIRRDDNPVVSSRYYSIKKHQAQEISETCV